MTTSETGMHPVCIEGNNGTSTNGVRDVNEANNTIFDHSDILHQTTSSNSQNAWDLAFHGKIYCRTNETNEILKSYERMKNASSNERTEVIIINGETGVGKTSLAYSMRSVVSKDGGYFISGKFDQLHSPEPYSAFIAALTDFSKAVISRGDAEIARVRKNVEMHIKTEQRVITNMIPSLRDILSDGKESGTLRLNDNISIDATNRFKYVFTMLIRAISSKEYPLIFFLDDLHWADESSLDLFHNLLLDASYIDGIIYVGTYRSSVGVFEKSLDGILTTIQQDNMINPSFLALHDLGVDDVETLLSESFKLDPELTKSLTHLVYDQTKGNIFYILECLRYLHSQSVLFFDSQENEWKWTRDENGNIALRQFNSLHDFIIFQLRRLPTNFQELLKYSACFGSTFSGVLIQHLVPEPISPILYSIAKCGLIDLDEIKGVWKFSHDCIHEAVYGLIIPVDQCEFHYRIGRKLWRGLTLDELDYFIFIVVGQLLLGKVMMNKEEERMAVAKLCFRAGERAVQVSSFRSAFGYLSQAIALLSPQSWRRDYDFCLCLYNAAAEVAYRNGDFESVSRVVEETFKNARLFEHTIQAHAIKLYSLGSNGHLNEAVECGLAVLRDLGEDLPSRPSKLNLTLLLFKVKKKLRDKSDQDLLNLPLMTDPQKLDVMKIINAIYYYIHATREDLAAFIGLRLIIITLDHGLSFLSSYIFIEYGHYLGRYGKNIEGGFRFGRIGLQMFEKFGTDHWIGRVFCAYYGFVHKLKMPFKECIEPLKYSALVALEKGDIEYAFFNQHLALTIEMQVSCLIDVYKDLQILQKQMVMFGQSNNLVMITPMVLSLQSLLDCETANDAEFINDREFDKIETTNKNTLFWIQFNRVWISYIFGNYRKAYSHLKACQSYLGQLTTSGSQFIFLFVGLVHLEYSHHYRRNKRSALSAAGTSWKMLKTYAKYAPCNALGKQFLLAAELAAFHKKNFEAIEKFTIAVSLLRNEGLIFETALSNERAAIFFMRIGEIERSKHFFQESLLYYQRWGCKRKVMQLSEEIKKI